MIRFDRLERDQDARAGTFRTAGSSPFVVIDSVGDSVAERGSIASSSQQVGFGGVVSGGAAGRDR